jgi:hypothetical protein
MGMIGYQHAYHTLPKVSFLLSDFAQALQAMLPGLPWRSRVLYDGAN